MKYYYCFSCETPYAITEDFCYAFDYLLSLDEIREIGEECTQQLAEMYEDMILQDVHSQEDYEEMLEWYYASCHYRCELISKNAYNMLIQ